MPLATPVLTVLISLGGILALGAGLHSVIPERYWGDRIPTAFLRYLFCGLVGWAASFFLVCFVPFVNKVARDFIIALEFESFWGQKLDAYTFIASLLAFLVAALLLIVNGIYRDSLEKKQEKQRQVLMRNRQNKIDNAK